MTSVLFTCSMMKFLPMFPLELIAYPAEQVNLHIYEPRYKELINECYNNKSTFGLLPYLNEEHKEYGTEMQVKEIVKTYNDGKMDIKTVGVGIFRMIEFIKKVPNKLYSGGIISRVDLIDDSISSLLQKNIALMQELFEIMRIESRSILEKENLQSFNIAHHVGFSIVQEYELLSVKRESVRLKLILEHLKRVIPVIREAELLKEKIKLNGHFKNIQPPI